MFSFEIIYTIANTVTEGSIQTKETWRLQVFQDRQLLKVYSLPSVLLNEFSSYPIFLQNRLMKENRLERMLSPSSLLVLKSVEL